MQKFLAQLIGPISVILPIVLLALKFALKLAVDQRVSVVAFVRSTISVPIDIVFLSLSFFVAFAISPAAANVSFSFGQAISVVVVLVILSVCTIASSRRSDHCLDSARFIRCILAALLSYTRSNHHQKKMSQLYRRPKRKSF